MISPPQQERYPNLPSPELVIVLTLVAQKLLESHATVDLETSAKGSIAAFFHNFESLEF